MKPVRWRVELWCTCGGTLDVRGMSQLHVDVVEAVFGALHRGAGHGPASPHQAAAARRARRSR